MKKAIIERIITKAVFITSDGKDFEDFRDALEHETEYLSSIDELRMFDAKGNRTLLLDSTETVYLGTPRATEVFIDLHIYESYDYDGLCEASLDWYLWDGHMWESPTERLERCKEKINEQLELCGGAPIE